MTKVWHSYFYSKLILNSGIPELSTKDSIISYNMRHEWHFLIYEWMYDFHFDIIGINIWLYRSRNTEYIYIYLLVLFHWLHQPPGSLGEVVSKTCDITSDLWHINLTYFTSISIVFILRFWVEYEDNFVKLEGTCSL